MTPKDFMEEWFYEWFDGKRLEAITAETACKWLHLWLDYEWDIPESLTVSEVVRIWNELVEVEQ